MILSSAFLMTSNARAQSADTLLDETFITGNYTGSPAGGTTWTDNGQAWTWSSVSGPVSPYDTETYGANAYGARGMQVNPINSSYGGFEVISDPSPALNSTWQVATRVSLPSSFSSTTPATISFEYGFRGSVIPATFDLYDVTTQTDIFSQSLSASTTGNWQSDNITLNAAALSNVAAGNILSLGWEATSNNSAVSLEVGGPVIFTVGTSSVVSAAPATPAPPLSACLAFASVLALQAFRRKKD